MSGDHSESSVIVTLSSLSHVNLSGCKDFLIQAISISRKFFLPSKLYGNYTNSAAMKMKLKSLRHGPILFEVFLRLASFLNPTSSRRENCHRLQMGSGAAFYKVRSDCERTDSLFDQTVSRF